MLSTTRSSSTLTALGSSQSSSTALTRYRKPHTKATGRLATARGPDDARDLTGFLLRGRKARGPRNRPRERGEAHGLRLAPGAWIVDEDLGATGRAELEAGDHDPAAGFAQAAGAARGQVGGVDEGDNRRPVRDRDRHRDHLGLRE